MLAAHVICEIGVGRPTNQDAYVCNTSHGLFAVIDGVALCSDGGLAAAILRESIARHCVGNPNATLLRGAFLEAHKEMLAQLGAHYTSLQTVGSVLWIDATSGQGLVAHVGDTRIFTASEAGIVQHTVDHTELRLMGTKSVSVPVRVVGGGGFEDLGPEITKFELKHGSIAFLATDGAYKYAGPTYLAAVTEPDLATDEAASILFGAALAKQREKGFGDNITIIAVRRVA